MAVRVDPATASHMSGAAISLCIIAPRSAKHASATPKAATTASQPNARSSGGARRRTGRRSLARSWISASDDDIWSDIRAVSFRQTDTQRFEGAMQVYFQSAFGAAGGGGRLLEGTLSQGKFFNRLTLSFG